MSDNYNYDKIREYEVEFCKTYNSNNKNKNKKMIHLDTAFKHDFEIEYPEKENKRVELKVDFHKNSKNFFIETISNTTSGRVGGAKQAQSYGADFFVVWFPKDSSENVWVFDNDKLVEYMDENKSQFYYHEVKNDGYMTGGYIVPKAELIRQGLVQNKRQTYRSVI